MRLALRLKLVEKSADNHVDFKHKMANFEAKLALAQFKTIQKNTGKKLLENQKDTPVNRPLRTFFLVENRDKILKELKKTGYYFDAFWYETPISPKRYFKKSGFDIKQCPVAAKVSEHILNFPNYYSKKELAAAYKIIERAVKWEAK